MPPLKKTEDLFMALRAGLGNATQRIVDLFVFGVPARRPLRLATLLRSLRPLDVETLGWAWRTRQTDRRLR
jgi:hypothetical protein